jgi:hypothetical protein
VATRVFKPGQVRPRTRHDADPLLRRMEQQAVSLTNASGFEHSPYLQPGQPRWHLSPKWIEFECGCVAERMNGRPFLLPIENYDPVIFQDVPEENMLSLYLKVCDRTIAQHVVDSRTGEIVKTISVAMAHQKMMFESRIKFSHRMGSTSGYADFNDWARRRRPFLIGER